MLWRELLERVAGYLSLDESATARRVSRRACAAVGAVLIEKILRGSIYEWNLGKESQFRVIGCWSLCDVQQVGERAIAWAGGSEHFTGELVQRYPNVAAFVLPADPAFVKSMLHFGPQYSTCTFAVVVQPCENGIAVCGAHLLMQPPNPGDLIALLRAEAAIGHAAVVPIAEPERDLPGLSELSGWPPVVKVDFSSFRQPIEWTCRQEWLASAQEVTISGCPNLRCIAPGVCRGSTVLQRFVARGLPCLKEIGNGAFACPAALHHVDLAGCSALQRIGSGAFENCRFLETVLLDGLASLQVIGSRAFSYAGSLTEIHFSSCISLRTLGFCSFFAAKIRTLDFSGHMSLTEIGDSAFQVCSNLQTVSFCGAKSLTELGQNTFYACAALESVSFSGCEKLRVLKSSCFKNCEALKLLCFEGCSSLVTVGEKCFEMCKSLTAVCLSPATSLRRIEPLTFRQCVALTDVDFSGMTSLERVVPSAFAECTTLTSLNLSHCPSLQPIEGGISGGGSYFKVVQDNNFAPSATTDQKS